MTDLNKSNILFTICVVRVWNVTGYFLFEKQKDYIQYSKMFLLISDPWWIVATKEVNVGIKIPGLYMRDLITGLFVNQSWLDQPKNILFKTSKILIYGLTMYCFYLSFYAEETVLDNVNIDSNP